MEYKKEEKGKGQKRRYPGKLAAILLAAVLLLEPLCGKAAAAEGNAAEGAEAERTAAEGNEAEAAAAEAAEEYTAEDISWIIDKMAAYADAQEPEFNSFNIYSEEMFALYRSGRPVSDKTRNRWYNEFILPYINQYIEGSVAPLELDIWLALRAAGKDVTNIGGTDLYTRQADIIVPDNKKDNSGFMVALLALQGTQLEDEYYDPAVEMIKRQIEISIDNYGVLEKREMVDGVQNTRQLIKAALYGKGDEEIHSLLEEVLLYYTENISETDNTFPITILASMGYDPFETSFYLPLHDVTAELSVDGVSLMEHLLARLCDGNGEVLDREKAMAADKLAFTYTLYEYITPTVIVDYTDALIALTAYERSLKGECGVWDFSDVAEEETPSMENRLPQLEQYRYREAVRREERILRTGGSLSLNVVSLFVDPDGDELTYWMTRDGGEAQQITLEGIPEYMKESPGTVAWYGEDKNFWSFTSDPAQVKDGHQTVELEFFAMDGEGRSPGYQYVVEIYDDPSLEWLHYKVGKNAVTITGCDSNATVLIIPEEIEGKPVTNIVNTAFHSKQKLESIVIPDTVQTIGQGAFSGCRALRTANLPASLKQMGEEAFYGCQRLEELTIPKGLYEFYESAYAGCTRLQLHVEEGHESFSSVDGSLYSADGTILYRAGYQEDGEFVIPDTVVEIGRGGLPHDGAGSGGFRGEGGADRRGSLCLLLCRRVYLQ